MRHVVLSNLDRRTMSVGGFLTLAAIAMAYAPETSAGQGNRTKVTYTVEFRTTGALLDNNCTASGTDILTGTIVGFEPPLPNDDNEYVGTLTRTTRLTTCGIRRKANGEDEVCSINYVGNGFADVTFTIYEGQRGGYLQYIPDRTTYASLLPPRPNGPVNSVVTGTCEPAELSQLQSDYAGGETAGSPNGQPLEVPRFPPLSSRPVFPLAFPPNPPRSVWTLTVLARQP